MKHQANLVTVRWRRRPAHELSASLQRLGEEGPQESADHAARRMLAELEHHLTAGHEAYHRGRPAAAVTEYKLAQGLILETLDPRVSARAAERRGRSAPVDEKLFRPLLAAGFELVEALEPAVPQRRVGSFARLPAGVSEALKPLTSGRVRFAEDRVQAARNAAEIAASLAERGQWARALESIQQGRADLGAPGTEAAREAAAALDLSEAALRIQTGDAATAATLLRRAGVAFEQGRDVVGQAQVEFNRAALLKRQGQREQAAEALQRAGTLLDQAQGREAPATGSQPGPTVPRLRSAGTVVARRGRGSVELQDLDDLRQSGGLAVTYRLPGRGGGWFNQAVESVAEARERSQRKSLTLTLGEQAVTVEWVAGGDLPLDELIAGYFQKHAAADSLAGLIGAPDSDAELAILLPHLYLYLIPLALADALHALGDYAAAESLYLAVARYPFLNLAIELPALWRKIAENVLAWGDKLYKADEVQQALGIYRKVVEPPQAPQPVPASAPLYAHARLGVVGAQVKEMLQQVAGGQGIGEVNPLIAAVVLEIRARLLQIASGLDFLGLPAQFVPIWSFDFLQGVARYFAQQASQTEREAMRFRDTAENEQMTILQVQQAVDITAAESKLAHTQVESAEAERDVYALGIGVALVRVELAKDDRDDYEDMGKERNEYNAQIVRESKGIDEDDPEAVFASLESLRDRRVLQYELAARERQIQELGMALEMAQAQHQAAEARVEVAKQMEVVAQLKHQAVAEQLEAYEDQFFTPDVWKAMSNFLAGIAKRYLAMATRTARLMQRAYNFEFDENRQVIRLDYAGAGVQGLLGADLLLLDVDSFTFSLLNTVRPKQTPVKETISLAASYPFPFENTFRATGKLDFETRLLDFDLRHPGTFARRLERVEVEIDGVLPASGVHGTLTNAGISLDRKGNGDLRFRVQSRETLPLSQYRIREDTLVFPAETRQLAVFEGAGVASTWTLELPRATNDLDFEAITDVRLVFYYQARYSPTLAEAVRAEIAATPGFFASARHLTARWLYPDSFFSFLDTGRLELALPPQDLPYHHTQPRLRHLALRLFADAAVAGGATVRLATPDHPETALATLDGTGLASSVAGHPWEPLVGGAVTGSYTVELRAEENPGLVRDGRLDLAGVRDVLLFLEYDYTPR
jgi:hypothetical protein